MDLALPSYRYQPLPDDDSIRLLCLQPSSSHDTDLRGFFELTTVSKCFNDFIDSFTALSYVWGDPMQTGFIHIDQCRVKITASLEAALRDMCDSSRVHRVWADALCVNQCDDDEKAKQVASMDRIYRSATHTIIYLGPLTPGANRVLESAQKLSGCGFGSLVEPDEGKDALFAVAEDHLLSRPWFRRVWTFQELVASRDPWIQCGTKSSRWIDICNLLLPARTKTVSSPLSLLQNMDDTRKSNANALHDLLIERRGFSATDARDMIYAHIGIATDRALISQNFKADYSETCTTVDLYIRYANYALAKRSSNPSLILDQLDDSTISLRLDGLPSWVPDWSQAKRTEAPVHVFHRPRYWQLQRSIFGTNDSRVIAAYVCSLGILEEVTLRLDETTLKNHSTLARLSDCFKQLNELFDFSHTSFVSTAPGDQEPERTRVTTWPPIFAEAVNTLGDLLAALLHQDPPVSNPT